MLIAKERPGVYWDYDASGVLWGSDSLKQVGIAALCENGEQNRVYSIRRISDGKAVFGEDSIMAGMIEKALINGASGVKAVKAGTEESFDYEAALAALDAAGIKTAVVSNKPDATTKTLAARFFPGLPAFGQRDDVPPKPSPDLVFRALDTLGVAAADAVYVGDSEVDVATARNAGLPLAAVSWGFRGRQALAQAGAETIVDTAEQLLEVLR